jgi:hypothetical protein
MLFAEELLALTVKALESLECRSQLTPELGFTLTIAVS